MSAYPSYWLEVMGQTMKINKHEHELSIIAIDALANLYKSLPNELSHKQFAEVLLEISYNLVVRARIAVKRIDDAEETE